jgi:hypothetical protein
VRTLQSAAWTAPTGLTVTPLALDGTRAAALISGGVEGQSYEVTCVGTCSDGTKPVMSITITVAK